MPARGYASHGESWSLALALRLASFDLLRGGPGREDPVLILDDVFAELDAGRRDRLAGLVAGAEQVLVTAAVPADVPPAADRRPLYRSRRRAVIPLLAPTRLDPPVGTAPAAMRPEPDRARLAAEALARARADAWARGDRPKLGIS